MRLIFRRQIESLGIRKGKCRILDVGCGTGAWTKELGDHGSIVGLDFSPEALAFSRDRGVGWLVRGSATAIPFGTGEFDMVTAFGLVEHIDDDNLVLWECSRVCTAGGYVLVLTSAYQWLWSYHDDYVQHKRRNIKSQFIARVRAAGLEPVRASYVNSILFPLIAAMRILQKLVGYRPVHACDTTRIFDYGGITNSALFAVMRVESRLLRLISFPFGVGLMCIARKV